MKILVLGTGCARCKALMQNVLAAVSALGIKAEIEKVEAIEEIMKYGVMSTPALVVDGEVKSAGKVPSPDEIQKVLS
jgi:small redox-active disulfide protein 2